MFHERLKRARLEKELTQTQIAYMLDISHPAYTQWENGKKKPRVDKLVKLSEILDISIDYLLGISDNPKIN